MLQIGIDEAGYGPVLGPLVIGLTAFRVAADDPPLARRLRGIVVRRPRVPRHPLPVPVDDSKVVHQRFGRKGLARTLALFAAARDEATPRHLGELLARHGARTARPHQGRPWYAAVHDAALPELPPLPALAERFRRQGVEAVDLRVRPVDAPELNERIEATDNKANVLGTVTGETLLEVLDACDDEEVRVCFDRQGGRLDYADYLQGLFPFARVRELPAEPRCARYEVRTGTRRLEALFLTGGDGRELTIAWASTVAKLARELFMDCVNAWFLERAPQVRPTAGYFRDGRRFLADVEPVLSAERIAPDTLVRAR